MIAFTWGFCVYPVMETLWRGYTHPTMCFAGGICALILYAFEKAFPNMNIFLKSFFGAFFITAVELVFGLVFNLIFRLGVWDYSSLPFNFMGQICAGYFFIWYLLCMCLIYLYKKTSLLLRL